MIYTDVTKTVSSCMNQLVLNIFWIRKPFHGIILLINSFVFSKSFYCSSVWGNTSKRNLDKLQLVQNFADRVVFNRFKGVLPHLLGTEISFVVSCYGEGSI